MVVITTSNFSKAQSGTNVSGTITTDTTWSVANNPFTLMGNVFVQNGVTLTINPGVTVYLNDHSIRVSGTLNACGTSDNRISFISLTPTLWSSDGIIDFLPGSSNWNEKTQAGCLIQNAIITYNQPVPAIYIDSTSPKVSNCSIIDPYPNNYNYGEAIEIISSTNVSASPMITYNTIGNAAYIGIWDGGNYGNSLISGNYIYDSMFGIESASNGSIIQNLLQNNKVGVGCENIWINNTLQANTTNRIIQNNTFIDNENAIGIGPFNNITGIAYNNFQDNFINLNGPSDTLFASNQFIDAANNWWGTTNLQAVNSSINCQISTVNYLPILTQPNPAAPSVAYNPNPIPVPSINPYALTITHIGQGTVLPSDGQYITNSTVTLSASPDTNYAFMCWLENGTLLSTTNPYSYSPTNNYVITAVFYDPVEKISASPSPTPTASQSPTPAPTVSPTQAPTQTSRPTSQPTQSHIATPTPTHTIPEFSAWIAISLVIGASLLFVALKRKNRINVDNSTS